jgi:uncharacterized protein
MSDNFALITGASGGLGREYTIQLLKQGYNLVLAARNKDRLDYFKDSLNLNEDQIVYSVECNVMHHDDVINLFQFLNKHHIKLRKIIHIAGLEKEGWFKDTSHDDIIEVASVNVVGSTNIIHRALEYKAEKLDILLMSSLAGFYPMPMKAVYAASKRYLIDLTRTLNYELKNEGVHLTAVCPAGMMTKPEVIQKIKALGYIGRITTVNFNVVVRKSLIKLDKHKTIYVPGVVNQIMLFLSRFIPKNMLVKSLGKRWTKTFDKKS